MEKFFRFKPCDCCELNQICSKYAIFDYTVVDNLICKTKIPISSLKDYKSGKIYGIDYSSCVAVQSLIHDADHNAKINIIELCCAPGAKMLYMMDYLPNCVVCGVDIRSDRLSVAKKLLRKYKHLDRVQLIVEDATICKISVPCGFTEGRKYESRIFHSPRHFNQSDTYLFDRVLVDTECTLDGKEHHVPKGLAKCSFDSVSLFKLQQSVLLNGFKHMKEGGTLVYSTCSLKVHENECVVYNLLSIHKNARLVVPSFWNKLPLDISEKHCEICDKTYLIGMRMDKVHLKTSGMFVAVINKI